MSEIKTVDGFTFPLTFVDLASYQYEAYYDNTGFWFKSDYSGNIFRDRTVWGFGKFKENVADGSWKIISQAISEKQPEPPMVTITEEEYHSLIEEVNMLQELVKELSAPQDTALEQQAETYRALNDALTRHESFQEGEEGASTTRCEELLNTIGFLHEVYTEWKTNDYQASVTSAGSDAFKPIIEYTLGDWQHACDEDWEFECRGGYIVRILKVELEEDVLYPVRVNDGSTRTMKGFYLTDTVHHSDIVKRIL